MEKLINANFENIIGATTGYSEIAYQFVSHILTLGYAIMLAGLFYFVLTIKNVAPKYRMSNLLSGVVMVSAFLLLFAQAGNWVTSFSYNQEAGK